MTRDISNAMAKATVERISEVMDTEKPNIVEDAVTPTGSKADALEVSHDTLIAICKALKKAGVGERQLDKLWGGNVERILNYI